LRAETERIGEIGTGRDLCLDISARLDQGALRRPSPSFLLSTPHELLVPFPSRQRGRPSLSILGVSQEFVVYGFGLNRPSSAGLTGQFPVLETQPIPKTSRQFDCSHTIIFSETTSAEQISGQLVIDLIHAAGFLVVSLLLYLTEHAIFSFTKTSRLHLANSLSSINISKHVRSHRNHA
jgi:hypothetical protein